MTELERERIKDAFSEAVNMSAAELEDWLATQESQKVGWKGADGSMR